MLQVSKGGWKRIEEYLQENPVVVPVARAAPMDTPEANQKPSPNPPSPVGPKPVHSLSHRETATSRTDRPTEVLVGLCLDILFMVIPAIAPLPVLWRWVIWRTASFIFVLLVLKLFKSQFGLPIKIGIASGVTLLFWLSTYTISQTQWREEKAAALEGDLIPLADNERTGTTTVQIGPNGPKFVTQAGGDILHVIMPLEALHVAYDAGLSLQATQSGVVLNTPVIDRDGNKVGEVVANHWKVYPPYCSDKNYTDNSIEMKDKAGHVVLQAFLYRDKIQIQGEWHTTLGSGERLIESSGGAAITFWKNPEQEKLAPGLIPPVFKYPSSIHWGELLSTTPQ